MRCSSEADKTVVERQSVAGNKEREKWREEEKEESGKKVSEEPPPKPPYLTTQPEVGNRLIDSQPWV